MKKTLLDHVRERSFRSERHADLLDSDDSLLDAADDGRLGRLADMQSAYREAEPANRRVIASAFAAAVNRDDWQPAIALITRTTALEVAVPYAPRRVVRKVAEAFARHPELELVWQPEAAELSAMMGGRAGDPRAFRIGSSDAAVLLGFRAIPAHWSARQAAELAVVNALQHWRELNGPAWLRQCGIPDREITRTLGRLPDADEYARSTPPSLDDAIAWLESGELMAWWTNEAGAEAVTVGEFDPTDPRGAARTFLEPPASRLASTTWQHDAA